MGPWHAISPSSGHGLDRAGACAAQVASLPDWADDFGIEASASTWRLWRPTRRDPPNALVVDMVTIPSWRVAARPRRCRRSATCMRPRRTSPASSAWPSLHPCSSPDVSSRTRRPRPVVRSSLPPSEDGSHLSQRYGRAPRSRSSPSTAARRPTPPRPRRQTLPRKGRDAALDAPALVRAPRVDAPLVVCGSVFPGYQWSEDQLRERARRRPVRARRDARLRVVTCRSAELAADVVARSVTGLALRHAVVQALLAEPPPVATSTQLPARRDRL